MEPEFTVSRHVRTLLVDDFAPWREYVRSVLDQVEFNILGEASDGEKAVSRAHELRPDLILLDIGLPGLDGIQAARLIRNALPEAKILFLSENRDADVVKAALEAGGHGYLVKSDCANELLVALRTVFRGEQFVSSTIETAPDQ